MAVDTLANALFMTHAMLAGIAKSPRWAIEQKEADMLAKAAGDVLRHYDVPGMDQKSLDWIGLLYAAGLVYGTRLVAGAADKKPAPAPQAPPPTELRPNANGMQEISIPGVPGKHEVPIQ